MNKRLIITVSKEDDTFEVANLSKVYIFDNISDEYKEEICDMIKNNIPYKNIKMIVESWGGEIDLTTIDEVVKSYKKTSRNT